jgi:hypothetical protein
MEKLITFINTHPNGIGAKQEYYENIKTKLEKISLKL